MKQNTKNWLKACRIVLTCFAIVVFIMLSLVAAAFVGGMIAYAIVSGVCMLAALCWLVCLAKSDIDKKTAQIEKTIDKKEK